MCRHAVEDGFLLFVLGKHLDGVVDLEEKGEDHGVVCGLVLRIRGWCCRGRAGLETVDEILEEGEAGVGLARIGVLCEIAECGCGCAGDALSDPEEAGVEDAVARDLGGEGVDLVPAGVALLVYVALLPSDEGALVDVGVALDVGVVRELELVPLGVVERHRGSGSVRVAVADSLLPPQHGHRLLPPRRCTPLQKAPQGRRPPAPPCPRAHRAARLWQRPPSDHPRGPPNS